MNQNENKKLIDKQLRSQLKCIAEDFFTDNLVSGYPVPDQDVKGRWHLSNGPGDFSIVKPETIKLASKESAPTAQQIKQVTEERDKAVELLDRVQETIEQFSEILDSDPVCSDIAVFLKYVKPAKEGGE